MHSLPPPLMSSDMPSDVDYDEQSEARIIPQSLVHVDLNLTTYIAPAGAVLRGPQAQNRPPPEPRRPQAAQALPVPAETRKRTLSGATVDTANVRKRMWRSLTDLFTNVGKVTVVCRSIIFLAFGKILIDDTALVGDD